MAYHCTQNTEGSGLVHCICEMQIDRSIYHQIFQTDHGSVAGMNETMRGEDRREAGPAESTEGPIGGIGLKGWQRYCHCTTE